MLYQNNKIILTWDDCIKIKNINKQGFSLSDSFKIVMDNSGEIQLCIFSKSVLDQWKEDNNSGGIYGPDVFNQLICEIETELIWESYK